VTSGGAGVSYESCSFRSTFTACVAGVAVCIGTVQRDEWRGSLYYSAYGHNEAMASPSPQAPGWRIRRHHKRVRNWCRKKWRASPV
jgi:hypothetical protein